MYTDLPSEIQGLINECGPDYEDEIIEVFHSTGSIDTTMKSAKVAYALITAAPAMISRSENLELLFVLAEKSNFILEEELKSQLIYLIKYKCPIFANSPIVKNGGTIRIGAIDVDNSLERIRKLSVDEKFEIGKPMLVEDAGTLNAVYLGNDEWGKIIAKVYNQGGKILYQKFSNNEYEASIIYPS